MVLNLNKEDSPDHVLDILPENEEETKMLLDFLSNFANRFDFGRVQVSPVGGGICIWVE